MSGNLFNIGVTGMQAQSDDLAVIGNNISNSSTCGYKSNSLTFSEVFVTHNGQYANGVLNQVGNGVTTTGVTTDWSTGSIESTGSASNLAITEDGFFCVSYNDQIYYTRAGDFTMVGMTVDGVDGYVLMRDDGSILLGGTIDSSTGLVVTTADSYVFFESCPDSYEISSDGVVTAVGAVVDNGQIGVQRFNNPDSLERIEGGCTRPQV